MNELKKGDLVKAWSIDPSVFFIGKYIEYSKEFKRHDVSVGKFQETILFKSAVKIPDELAKQLEDLK